MSSNNFIKIEEEAWELLFDHPAELFKIYCAIRRKMDYETCIAGNSAGNRISEQYLREVISYSARPGRLKCEPVTRQKIRHFVKYLEKLGLIENQGNFVFLCNLALRDQSAQKIRNPNGTNLGTEKITIIGTKKKTNKPLIKKDLSENKEPDLEPDLEPARSQIRNPHQISDNNNYKKHNYYLLDEKNLKNAPEKLINFELEEKHLIYAQEKKFAQPTADDIEAFKEYHLARPANWKKITQWDLAFYGWLRNKHKWETQRNATSSKFAKQKSSIDRALELCGDVEIPF